jgi:hypothetical protein
MVLTFTIHFVYIRKRILNTLFENILRAEETLEKWINRKIDNRVWDSLEGPLRTRMLEMVQAMVEESLKGVGRNRERPSPFRQDQPSTTAHEDER